MKPSLDQVVDRMGELQLRRRDYTRSENYEIRSKVYENESNTRWILRKGVGLGKKMVVTGLVVSSAPFVLPPLLTLSAIGFAFSLPVGFVIATYVCIDKLMNTLLPMPPRIPCVELRKMSSEEEDQYRFDDEVDEGYEEDDDEDDDSDSINFQGKTFKENGENIELVKENDRETRNEHAVMPIRKDEQDGLMSVNQNVEESGYVEDVDEDVDVEEQTIDSTKIPIIMEGIQEPEDEIPVMDRVSAEMRKESLRAFAGEAFVPPQDDGNLADIDIEVNETVDKRSEEENETGIANEQPELVIERMLLVDVNPSGDHNTTDAHQGKSGFDAGSEVPDLLRVADALGKGEDLVSEDAVDLSSDDHDVRTESTSLPEHAATRPDQGSTTNPKKEIINEEKIREQIQAMRTIVGYKTSPHASSCVEELEALYVFTGVELPVSSKDAGDLADVNDKLHSLMSIVGVK